jgi:hypothetical protein
MSSRYACNQKQAINF